MCVWEAQLREETGRLSPSGSRESARRTILHSATSTPLHNFPNLARPRIRAQHTSGAPESYLKERLCTWNVLSAILASQWVDP